MIFEIMLLVIIIIFFVVGAAGLFLPVIPALPVMWAGIVFYGIVTGFENVTMTIVMITGVMMLIGTALDFVAQALGAKFFGATLYGVLGSFVGGIIGFIFLNIIGLFVGAFVGTFCGEFIVHREKQKALNAAWGAFIGFLAGTAIKIFLAVAMVILFFGALF